MDYSTDQSEPLRSLQCSSSTTVDCGSPAAATFTSSTARKSLLLQSTHLIHDIHTLYLVWPHRRESQSFCGPMYSLRAWSLAPAPITQFSFRRLRRHARGRWKGGNGKHGTMKNTGVENVGLENMGPNGRGWKGRTGKRGTKFWGVEIAGLENAGPNLQGWKRQDHRLWKAKHHVIYIIGNMKRHYSVIDKRQ